MITEEKFNALIPVQHSLILEKGLLDKGFNEGHWLFMIITEMAEAVNAERASNFIYSKEKAFRAAETIDFNDIYWADSYLNNIKNTLPDEIADIYIRLLSYCACKNMLIDSDSLVLPQRLQKAETLPEKFMVMTGLLWKAHFHMDTDTAEVFISQFFTCLEFVTLTNKIDIARFIQIKMEHNKLMQPMNNKAY